MSNTKVFWGTFLICTGILLLMFQFGWINGGLGFVFNLWPLLIILWGFSLLNIQPIIKRILVAASGILLSLFIVALFSAGSNSIKNFKFWDNDHKRIKTENIDKKYKLSYVPEKHDTLSFEIEAAAGRFELEGITNDLVSVHSKGVFSDISLNYFDSDKELELEFDSGENINIDFDDNGIKRISKIYINPNVIWDIELDIGAASFYADLSEYKIRELRIKSGASGINAIIGEMYKDVKIFIDAGVSSVTISIPENYGCTIHEDTGLSGLQFDNFKKIGKGLYKTENSENAENNIYIELDGGVSDFNIERYKLK